jgi:hypothetical protein
MIYRNEDGAVVSLSEFKAAHPNTSFPATLSADLLDSFGYKEIVTIEVEKHPDYEVHVSDLEVIKGVPTITKTLVQREAVDIKTEKVNDFKNFVDTQLNHAATQRGYDNIVSACSYAVPGSTYYDDGMYFVNLRDAVWAEYVEICRVYMDDTSDITNAFFKGDIVTKRT